LIGACVGGYLGFTGHAVSEDMVAAVMQDATLYGMMTGVVDTLVNTVWGFVTR